MRAFIFTLIYFCFSFANLAYSQESRTILEGHLIKGFVFDSLQSTPLPFATVTNYEEVTITNEEGYFEFYVDDFPDTLYFSFIGYKTKNTPLVVGKKDYQIFLKESIVELKEINITPKDYSYLFDLIQECRENRSEEEIEGKAYYQLKSYANGKQVELVENYYNAIAKGYDLRYLELKTGRAGVREFDGSFFASLETSKPISHHKLFFSSSRFPSSPLQYSLNKMKKRYYLEPMGEYVEDGDSIIKVFLYPKKDRAKNFSANLWINKSRKNFLKIELIGRELDIFPLVPIYEGDYLSKRNLSIYKSFQSIGNQQFLEQIHFDYSFIYHKKTGAPYSVTTKALLHLYDTKNKFEIPRFEFLDKSISDYEKITALPHNHFFWNNNNELKLNSVVDTNSLFMNTESTYSIENYSFKDTNSNELTDIYKYLSIPWSKERLNFRELKKETPYTAGQASFDLRGKIYLEIDSCKSQTNVKTVALFDEYESYYFYRLDTLALCFINMYFDIVEINRKELETSIKESNNKEFIYQSFEKQLEELKRQSINYFNEVELGRNKEGMLQWNETIRKELGIDNLSLFNLYTEED